MKNSVKRCLASFLAVTAATMTFAACSSSNASNSTTPSKASATDVSVKRDDIVIALQGEPPTLHPFDHKAQNAGYFNSLTYSTLYRVDEDTLDAVPHLVKSHELLDDTTWQFKLHEGVKFHDGSDLTSEDVVASMAYAKTFPTTNDYSTFWDSVEAVDDLTFVIHTKGVYSQTLPNLTSIKVLPSELISSGNDFNANPVGSGPYKFVKQILGDKLEFVKFDDYFDKENTPTITNMTWKIIPEGSGRTIALEAGEVDYIVEVESADLRRLVEHSDIEVLKKPGTRVNFLTVNNEVAPFNNINFRKALNSAIDKESLMMVAIDGEGVVANAVTPSAFNGSTDAFTDSYDLEKAKAYLDASGVDPATVNFSCIASTDVNRRTAEVLQAAFKELGITMSIVSMDHASYLSAIMSGNYEAALSGYSSNTMDYYLNGLLHSNALNAANLPRVNSPELDALIDLAKVQIDETERNETYRLASELLNQMTPFCPLYTPTITRAYNSKLGGVSVSASGNARMENLYWMD